MKWSYVVMIRVQLTKTVIHAFMIVDLAVLMTLLHLSW